MTVSPAWLPPCFAFLLGAVLGSFLNVCIYRIPEGISLSDPRRSFCPQCKTTVAWYHNIPILSYFWLRGRCANCSAPFSFRYPLVEALTASLFAAAWVAHPSLAVAFYWLLLSLLLVASFIDIDHLIIPDEITLGGTLAALLLCLAFPSLMGTGNHLLGLGFSLLGAASGFLLLWVVVEAGKLAFGKKRHTFDAPRNFVWRRLGETAELDFGEELLPWEEVFSRASDRLLLDCQTVEIPGHPPLAGTLQFRYDTLFLPDGSEKALDDLEEFRGTATSLTIPREAMGFGDVKFLAMIGAFLGWQAVLFTIFASSIIGSVVGMAGILLSRGKTGNLLPFGPFLALGATLWLLGGNLFCQWYFSRFSGSIFSAYVR